MTNGCLGPKPPAHKAIFAHGLSALILDDHGPYGVPGSYAAADLRIQADDDIAGVISRQFTNIYTHCRTSPVQKDRSTVQGDLTEMGAISKRQSCRKIEEAQDTKVPCSIV